MMFANIVCDSVSPDGVRLTTFHLRYWRAIHSELMTHRVFSRNARSSRAVPSRVLLTEPIFVPEFGINQPGMQSEIKAVGWLQNKWSEEWQQLADICREHVDRWQSEGMHKQHANRPLEWFGWIDVLVSSTYWENFFDLRVSEYAQPEFDELARMMQHEMSLSTPRALNYDQWHLPYITEKEADGRWGLNTLQMMSVARCARLSYKPFDGKGDVNAEIERYNKLVVSRPVHASPAEHQAMPDFVEARDSHSEEPIWRHPELHGNFTGWIQYRKTLEYEASMERF